MTFKNQDYTLFGTKIINNETNELGLILFTWDNSYADKDVQFATCVDVKGKKYNINMDFISPIES